MHIKQLHKSLGRTIAMLCALVLTAPSYAGVITIDFRAEVVNADGQFGPRGSQVRGLITFELTELANIDASAEQITITDGQLYQTELGFVSNVTFDLFPIDSAPRGDSVGSVSLSVSNGPQGDRFVISTRSLVRLNEDLRTEISLGISGTPELFQGDAPLTGGLSALESLLTSFDPSQQIPTNFNVVHRFGRRSFQENVFRTTSITISSAPVPEPTQLGILLLGLGLLLRKTNQPQT